MASNAAGTISAAALTTQVLMRAQAGASPAGNAVLTIGPSVWVDATQVVEVPQLRNQLVAVAINNQLNVPVFHNLMSVSR